MGLVRGGRLMVTLETIIKEELIRAETNLKLDLKEFGIVGNGFWQGVEKAIIDRIKTTGVQAWAIEWKGYGADHVDRQKIFLKEADADACLMDCKKGCSDTLPVKVTFTINGYYDDNIWYDKWGFSGRRKELKP
jgi:hypothetical protein